ncbi:hypothetical protein FALB51S_02776 [Frigidibacter albus]
MISPWHVQRHERIWTDPDAFDPERWQAEACRRAAREAWLPFSAGPRVCTGAGFAMIEGPLILAVLVRAFRFEPVAGRVPVPVAHLTVRAKDGIWLRPVPRLPCSKYPRGPRGAESPPRLRRKAVLR